MFICSAAFSINHSRKADTVHYASMKTKGCCVRNKLQSCRTSLKKNRRVQGSRKEPAAQEEIFVYQTAKYYHSCQPMECASST
jgi:hypothetical protein